jgi:A/G-specific adenine glycosylase
MNRFAPTLIAWQRRAGRRDLPWQGTRDPYRIWLSEIMLQQTQVAAVVPYYERFLARFPDVQSLARGSLHEVLGLWSGLGYYARARNLHRAARDLARGNGKRFPGSVDDLVALPGIGRSTAGAIAAFAFGRRAAILDGNVKRLLARCFGIAGYPGEAAVATQLWSLAESLLPRRAIEDYTQALMDLGATVCTRTRPQCGLCPLRAQCVARREDRVDQLPTPRPRRALALRCETWLVLQHGDRVLLEPRTAEGLWGGLWVFPRSTARTLRGIRGAAQRAFGCEIGVLRPGTPFEHGFTHFRLRIQPMVCEVTRAAARLPDGAQWLRLANLDRPARWPVPVPVRRILRGLQGPLRPRPAPAAPAGPPAPRAGARGAPRRRRVRAVPA